jgi:kynurenine 3-monooxygenase
MSDKKRITIIGSGLVGSLLSIFLAKRGHSIQVIERRQDMRKTDAIAGRSINLALSDRGWKALDLVGVGDEIRKIAIPMFGRFIHNIDGSTGYQAYGKDKQAIYSVSRGGINCKLMDLAEQQENVCIKFDERCERVNLKNTTAYFVNNQSNVQTAIESDLIFSSDGAFSAGRLQMQLATDRFNYNQFYIECGYKELTIPAGKNGEFLLEKNALHIWPRGKFMMIALPNFDGSFTCTLFFPFEGENSFGALKSDQDVQVFFEKYFSDAVPLMPTLLKDYKNNATASLVTVKCFPWTFDDKFALIGDAAHAIVPFFGQGMNCGFEDCTVLDGLLNEHVEDWTKVLPEFEARRKPDSDAIADLAIGNFVEMRDLVGQPQFLLQKKIEAAFSLKYPDKWIPAYSMVTFSPEIRYSEALRNGKRQQEIMDKVMAMPNIQEKWDSKEVENIMLAEL